MRMRRRRGYILMLSTSSTVNIGLDVDSTCYIYYLLESVTRIKC